MATLEQIVMTSLTDSCQNCININVSIKNYYPSYGFT